VEYFPRCFHKAFSGRLIHSLQQLWPFQQIYVLLASFRATSSLAAPYSLVITPPVKESGRYVILGGNHHIRLIDSKTRQCFVICKAGFDRDMLARDFETRRRHPFLPAPRIYDFDEEFAWYREDFISGTPINRLKNIEKAKVAVESVSTALKTLYESTLENIPLSQYSKRLADRIGTAVSLNKLLSDSDKSQILSTADTLKQILSPERKKDIRTVQSHGDFQPANILADNDNTWLIDWEYTQRRQAAYDSLVFSLQSRFPDKFSSRVETALNGSLEVINNTSCFDWVGKASRHISLALFLLEEIDLRLMEISNPMILKIDNGFFTFSAQAAQAAQKLASI